VERLKESVHILEKAGKNAGLRINAEKTKTMTFGIQDTNSNILIESRQIKYVAKFVYLGSTIINMG